MSLLRVEAILTPTELSVRYGQLSGTAWITTPARRYFTGVFEVQVAPVLLSHVRAGAG